MDESVRIGKVFGIPIELHFSFLLLMAFFALMSAYSGSAELFVYILLVFFFVVLHELTHSLVALRYGTKISRIVLLPFGGVASMERMPSDAAQELKIALAGPSFNFFAALLAFVPLVLLGATGRIFPLFDIRFSWDAADLLAVVIKINLLLGTFNLLIPALPMDGGRIFRALLALHMSYVKATNIAANLAKVLAVLMFFVGLAFSHLMLLFIAFLVYIGATQEAQTTTIVSLLGGIKVKEIMSKSVVALSPEMSLEEVSNVVMLHRHLGYPVVQGEKLLGIITFSDLGKIPKERWTSTKTSEVMSREVVTTSPEEEVVEVLYKMGAQNIGRLPVLENGKLVGMVSRTDIFRIIEVMRLVR